MDKYTYKKVNTIKPILKWVGGKSQIIEKIMSEFPVEINNYHEIFLGGGSVLLSLLCYIQNGIIKINGNIYAYDINEALIYVYKNIQTKPIELYDELQILIMEFHSCGNSNEKPNREPTTISEAKVSKESYYYWIRSEYNKFTLQDKKTVKCSAMFIFLNKTCFRGIFRIGPKGFNVPYGNYHNPEIINKHHLIEIHNLIQNVTFVCCDFNESLNNVTANDYVYIDPPYVPEKSTSFVKYTENSFTLQNHIDLFVKIHKLTELKIKMMLSNADVKVVRDTFCNYEKNEKYNIIPIVCKRSINSKNPESKAKEVIIKNY
jgi:DNA adenine methylase